MHTFCIVVARDAIGARVGRFGLASARAIARTLTLGVHTRSSYLQPDNLARAMPFSENLVR